MNTTMLSLSNETFAYRVPLEVHRERGQIGAENKPGLALGPFENDRVLLQLRLHGHHLQGGQAGLRRPRGGVEAGFVSGAVHTVAAAHHPRRVVVGYEDQPSSPRVP